jgi:hypothetical protein
VVVLSDGHLRSACVAQHVGACFRQQLRVAVTPFGQRRHCLERPVGIAMDVLGQVLGE